MTVSYWSVISSFVSSANEEPRKRADVSRRSLETGFQGLISINSYYSAMTSIFGRANGAPPGGGNSTASRVYPITVDDGRIKRAARLFIASPR